MGGRPTRAPGRRSNLLARLLRIISDQQKYGIIFNGVGMKDRVYYVNIMTNKHNRVLYTGVTKDLYSRVQQHKAGLGSKFTSRYRVTKLVYYESYAFIEDAITREKQIKGGSRQDKIDLVDEMNPNWEDLSEAWEM
jgi:putative endonuclease